MISPSNLCTLEVFSHETYKQAIERTENEAKWNDRSFHLALDPAYYNGWNSVKDQLRCLVESAEKSGGKVISISVKCHSWMFGESSRDMQHLLEALSSAKHLRAVKLEGMFPIDAAGEILGSARCLEVLVLDAPYFVDCRNTVRVTHDNLRSLYLVKPHLAPGSRNHGMNGFLLQVGLIRSLLSLRIEFARDEFSLDMSELSCLETLCSGADKGPRHRLELCGTSCAANLYPIALSASHHKELRVLALPVEGLRVSEGEHVATIISGCKNLEELKLFYGQGRHQLPVDGLVSIAYQLLEEDRSGKCRSSLRSLKVEGARAEDYCARILCWVLLAVAVNSSIDELQLISYGEFPRSLQVFERASLQFCLKRKEAKKLPQQRSPAKVKEDQVDKGCCQVEIAFLKAVRCLAVSDPVPTSLDDDDSGDEARFTAIFGLLRLSAGYWSGPTEKPKHFGASHTHK